MVTGCDNSEIGILHHYYLYYYVCNYAQTETDFLHIVKDYFWMATLFGNVCGLVCRGFVFSSVTKCMHRHSHYITLLYLFTMLAILVHLFGPVQ
jgi:hypothetical protein